MKRRYSLANHILSIVPDDPQLRTDFGTITIGGQGSYLDSITIELDNDLWSTSSYNTGAWIHNKNLSRTGSATVSISQLSDEVYILMRLSNKYYEDEYNGFTITLSDQEGTLIATCVDCYIQKIPNQQFQNEAQNQDWAFTCGQITFS